MYRKLKRTWSHNDLNYIPRFKEQFPELERVCSEELCDRFIEMKMDFYCEQKQPVNFLMRLTLPFAILIMFLMFLLLPVNFLFTGNWGYSFEKKYLTLLNWFRALRITF